MSCWSLVTPVFVILTDATREKRNGNPSKGKARTKERKERGKLTKFGDVISLGSAHKRKKYTIRIIPNILRPRSEASLCVTLDLLKASTWGIAIPYQTIRYLFSEISYINSKKKKQ